MKRILVLLFILVLIVGVFFCLKSQRESEKFKILNRIKKEGVSNTVQPEGTIEEVVNTFEKLLSLKYQKNIESVEVKVTKYKGDFIVGNVTFDGASGGYLLGAKLLGDWRIVFDGNGYAPCNVLDQIQFPSNMQAECWDTKTNQLVDRTKRPGMILQQ